jgi:antitoxin PrlF
MSSEVRATLTSKGQITVPADVRRKWKLKAGDQICFLGLKVDEGTIRPRRRRSIFESREELLLPSLGRSLTQTDIDDAISEAVVEKFGPAGKKRS